MVMGSPATLVSGKRTVRVMTVSKTKSRKRGGGTGEPKLRKACEFCTIKKIKYVSRGRVGDLPGGR